MIPKICVVLKAHISEHGAAQHKFEETLQFFITSIPWKENAGGDTTRIERRF